MAAPQNFFEEVWRDVRPYCLLFFADLLRTLLFLAVMKVMTLAISFAAPHGWSGKFIVYLHDAGAVVLFGALIIFLIRDVIHLKKSEHKQ